MHRSTRRLLILLASLPLALLVFALMYKLGMTYLEGRPHTLWESVEWAAETLTTTGYGADARWRHPAMVAFVILVQFSGVFLIFMIFPVYLIPYFEEHYEARLPRRLPALAGEVLIFRYGPAVTSLIDELRRFHNSYIIIESDESAARRLQERGHSVVLLDLNDDEFDPAALLRSEALVANGSDHDNAILTIAARECGYEGRIFALTEDPLHRLAMTTAGADVVFTPRHALAAALAARASERISPSVSGVQQIGPHIGVAQLRVNSDSPLAGRTLDDVRIRETVGATVIGVWHGGKLIDSPTGATRLARRSILIAMGSREALARLGELATPTALEGDYVVAGYGEVGTKVTQLLRDADETVIVINDGDVDGVDVVGNVLNRATLEAAKVREARAVILTIGNDSEALFAAAMLREYAPDVPLLARVNHDRSVARLHRLGVDFALSVGQVAGQLLAYHILGEDYVGVEPGLKIVSVDAGELAGRHPWYSGVREDIEGQIVAVGRGSDVHVEFPPEFAIDTGDVLYLCGAEDALDAFFAAHPGARPRA